MHIKNRFTLLILILSLFLCVSLPTEAQIGDNGQNASVILILVDGLSFEDLLSDEAEGLREIAKYGGAGLINLRTGGGLIRPAGYLTLGSGARAVAGDLSGLAYSDKEVYQRAPAHDLYTTLTGEIPLEGSVVNLGMPQLLEIKQNWNATPGLLGDRLNQGGIDVRVYGNSDTPFEDQRFGVLVAMNSLGQVRTGSVAKTDLLSDQNWPFGLRTNYDLILEQIISHADQPGLTVVELGDLTRLSRIADLLTDERVSYYRQITIERISSLMINLKNALLGSALDLTHYIYILTPSPRPDYAAKGYLLGPLISAVITKDASPSDTGIITSSSTRRKGIAVNYDLTSTILRHFSLPTDDLIGRTVEILPSKDVWTETQAIFDQIARVHRQRGPIVKLYIYIQVSVILATVAVLILSGAFCLLPNWLRSVFLWLHLSLVSIPLALLLLPLLPGADSLAIVGLQVLLFIGIVICIAFVWRRLGPTGLFTFILIATVFAILLDTLTGANLMKRSHLGYDPMGGSRYYGIGNEFMGILIGSAIMASGGIMDMIKKYRPAALGKALGFISVGFVLIVLALASPWHGINFGGAITGVVGFGVGLAWYFNGKSTMRYALLILGVLVLAVTGILIADLIFLGEDGSHVGATYLQAKSSGIKVLWDIIRRKISMNLSLLQLTIWSYAFLISLGVTSILMIYPSSFLKCSLPEHSYNLLAVKATLVAAVTTLVVNDSGIVAAAVMMVPVVSTSCYLLLHNVKRG